MEDARLEFLLDAVDRISLCEGFADSLDDPDPVPLAVFPRVDVAPTAQVDSNDGSGCGQRCWVRSRGGAAGNRSDQSMDRLNPRLRLGQKGYQLVIVQHVLNEKCGSVYLLLLLLG
ncbi:uncharacterized protein [Aegilops tauschii subsp. strangulata]|uniref:Uncharacterized protein n=1 Tax=Aegilops tauschii TaxID=37682 RepID=M8B1W1_AEGTA|nr:uncharacterized protein LOC109753976 isoform X1 [Aegilops tauschii subsp. strangulata]XP_044451337.1 uncharacterized protein LOC123182741 isoform X1 [Triticum aestivum]